MPPPSDRTTNSGLAMNPHEEDKADGERKEDEYQFDDTQSKVGGTLRVRDSQIHIHCVRDLESRDDGQGEQESCFDPRIEPGGEGLEEDMRLVDEHTSTKEQQGAPDWIRNKDRDTQQNQSSQHSNTLPPLSRKHMIREWQEYLELKPTIFGS